MKPELEDKLVKRWPQWFRVNKPPTESLMCFGFPGDGWFQLLWDLCEQLEPFVGDKFEVLQVKEKFGGLRFYLSFDSKLGGNADKIYQLIGAAETKSLETCEVCGKPGHIRDGGWLKTLCDEHAAGRKEFT